MNEQMKMNAPAESSIEEEINSHPNTDKTVVTEIDEMELQKTEEIVGEASKVQSITFHQ